MIRRPKPGESEDDLLEFQRQFLAEKAVPSATLVSKPGEKRKTVKKEETEDLQKDVVQLKGLPSKVPSADNTPPVKKSRFRVTQETRNTTKPGFRSTNTPDAEEFVDKHDHSMATVLTKIIERDTQHSQFTLPAPMTQPFPPVQHVRGAMKQVQTAKKEKKKSLFARQFEGNAHEFGASDRPDLDIIQQRSHDQGHAAVPGFPRTIDGTGLSATFGQSEAQKIHEENLTKISQMSQDEVMEEQKKLLEMIDPKLLEYLKARKADKKDYANTTDKTYTEMQKLPEPVTKHTSERHVQGEVPVPIDVKKEWVHMDRVEYDKLEWMNDLPAPSAGDNKTGQQARFDFHGNLLPTDVDIPVNVGLHHHGDEPERAGYTLEELFQLSRSSNTQQRVLGLQTLGQVIKQAKEGKLRQLIQTPILPSILDAGIIFLLRWSLDDSVSAVVIATVATLNALLVNQADELTLDKVFHWHQGYRVVCQASAKPENVGIKLPDVQDEKQEQTDAEMAKQDLVEALVNRMCLMPRLKYILEVIHPPAPTVIQSLQIITRVARHSTEVAYQIYNCKGLLDIIVQHFLPISWSLDETSQPLANVYGLPLTAAMKLMRTLCQAGRNITALLLSKYQLEDRLMRYLVGDTKSLQLPESEACGLQIESLNTWRICLSYGLADTVYLESYQTIVNQLRTVHTILDKPAQEQARVTALVCALEMAVCLASPQQRSAGFKHSKDGDSMEVESSEDVVVATLNWSHVADLIQPVRILLKSLLTELAASYQIKKPSLQLPSACLNFITTYYIHLQSQLSRMDTIKSLEDMEEIYTMCMQHWNSFGFQTMRSALCKHSNVLYSCDKEMRNTEMSSCLPEYGSSSVNEDEFLPIAGTNSPFDFQLSLLRLVYTFCKIHKGLLSKDTKTSFVHPSAVLQCGDTLTYLRKIAAGTARHLATNYLTKFENHLQYYMLKLATVLYQVNEEFLHPDRTMLHCVSLYLLTCYHHGDEHLVHDLLSTVIFNPAFWCWSQEEKTTMQLKGLNLTDATPTFMRSATESEIKFTSEQLCHQALTNMAALRATYLSSLGNNEKQLMTSRNHFLQTTTATETCFTSNIGECLMPLDWMFLPLIELYNTFASVGADVQNVLSSSQVGTICNTLRWIYLLEVHRPLLLERVSVTLKMSRIMCTFLTGNDMFLDRIVHCYLAGILRHYIQSVAFDKMDFTENIPGLPSFYDLYVGLLQQYEAVSFGDSLFGCYVMIPLQQKHSLQYRKAVWTEYTGILRTMAIPIQELLVPIQQYLEPEETNVELLRLYYQSLFGTSLRYPWAPVLYLMAVHHVNRFIYTQDGKHKQLKATMIRRLLASKNEELKQHLLHYKSADISQKFGMQFYESLPPIRQKYIDTFMSHSS